MREIKFRAWLKKSQKMKEIHTLFHMELATGFVLIDGKVAYCKTRDRGQTLAVLDYPDCELMQYTDLKDKNGKEIYEGDIMEFPYQETSESIIKQTRAVVEWKEQHFNPYRMYEGRVIGNIYENPDLLTK